MITAAKIKYNARMLCGSLSGIMRYLLRGWEQKEGKRIMWKTGIHWFSYKYNFYDETVNPRLVCGRRRTTDEHEVQNWRRFYVAKQESFDSEHRAGLASWHWHEQQLTMLRDWHGFS